MKIPQVVKEGVIIKQSRSEEQEPITSLEIL